MALLAREEVAVTEPPKGEGKKGRGHAYTVIYVTCLHVCLQIINWSLDGCCSVAFRIKAVI